ncbi:hypothetical protein MPTK1_3g09790 [Marchantia polymorpha subsp. ruderalis]|uniref:Uncharacterized protein n=2 Tax=Marchantia polymorpha TaxID=3197 RepID=A0AAF6AZ55_MARPO|nr:hypothetical protein MARPO_0085s0048 [Marchantia polymorpha]BBN05039.1 hypothetical protein Mp_3g09790 [Marchantia polymorpha subsp. ruderalis]|eukprot:PTQ33835.1 hypothetical protein MARPO_0085s0048 [Marchantia polymorpha]
MLSGEGEDVVISSNHFLPLRKGGNYGFVG